MQLLRIHTLTFLYHVYEMICTCDVNKMRKMGLQ